MLAARLLFQWTVQHGSTAFCGVRYIATAIHEAAKHGKANSPRPTTTRTRTTTNQHPRPPPPTVDGATRPQPTKGLRDLLANDRTRTPASELRQARTTACLAIAAITAAGCAPQREDTGRAADVIDQGYQSGDGTTQTWPAAGRTRPDPRRLKHNRVRASLACRRPNTRTANPGQIWLSDYPGRLVKLSCISTSDT